MPYIPPGRREELRHTLRSQSPVNVGELTYCITDFLVNYLLDKAEDNGVYRYNDLADCLAALDGSGKELYRRVIAPYEDTKIKLNGDVYQDLLDPSLI